MLRRENMKVLIISIFFFCLGALPVWGDEYYYGPDPNNYTRPYSPSVEEQQRDIQYQLDEIRLELEQQRIRENIDRLNRNNCGCDCDCW